MKGSLFACRLNLMPSQGAQAAPEFQTNANQQATAPAIPGGSSGGSAIHAPAPVQQPPPTWGQPPPGQDQYQQTPPKKSPY